METLVVVLGNIESTQTEIISCMITQICENLENASIIDFYKDTSLQFIISKEYDVIKAEQWKFDNWLSIYKHYRAIVKYFDNIILIKTPTLRGQYPRQLDVEFMKEIDNEIKKDKKYQMTQDLMKRLIEKLIFVRACRDKNVYQFCIDSEEVDFSKVYDFKKYKRLYIANHGCMEYFPMYEWAMSSMYIQEIPKVQDLYFICSAFTKEREEYMVNAKECVYETFGRRKVGYFRNNAKIGLFDYYNSTDRRDIKVNQNTYLYNLKLSKYTVVNKCYDSTAFNMMRFMESIICDCIPIIMNDCPLNDIRLTFRDIYDIIRIQGLVIYKRDKRNLPYPYYINSFVNMYDEEKGVIKLLKKSKSYKMITDQEYVKSMFEKLLNWR